MTMDRRNFLTVGGKFFIFTAAAGSALEYVLAAEPHNAPGYRTMDHWWAMMIDIEKCIGCGSCVRADKAENDVPLEPFYFRTWVERYHVDPEKEHPEVDSPDGGYHGFPEKFHEGDGSKNFFVPKMCNQCADSPCTQVCPVGATFVSPDGAVLVDKKYCLGCRYCIQACPYGCRYIDPRTETVDKCNLCYHRITKGLTTACAEVCPTGARRLGDLKDPKDYVHQYLRENKIQVLKAHLATQSKTYYNGLDGSVR
ncbi:MAG: 4Fe-4S dicluster domain-containing protein [Acidobacteria bacterium]|nr:4Fe-4S dicluster domain-containing protein [Acidobacteriota bacterium]